MDAGRSTQPGPRLRTSLVVAGVGAALFAIGAVVTGVHVARSAFGGPVVGLPADFNRHFSAGSYLVYQRTGTTSRSGGFSFSDIGPTTLVPSDVRVVGSDGTVVPVTGPGSVEETLNRGSATYTGAVRFTIDHDGSYHVTVRADGGIPEAVVGRSLGSTLHAVVGWLVLVVIGFGIGVVGLTMLIVGVVRRGRARQPVHAGAGGLPAPGWYPDPGRPGGNRWWDGSRWTEHTG